MRETLAIMLLLFGIAVPCLGEAYPSIAAQVNIENGTKQYVYTLTNDLSSGNHIAGFGVNMPKAGALAITDAWCSKQGWGVGFDFRNEDWSYWGCGALTNAFLAPGEGVILKLITSESVATADYASPAYLSNWSWYEPNTERSYGNSVLPVPVPEPSSLLVLAGGIAGLCGFALRRRRA